MDADRRFEARRFVTRHDVEDAHAAGRPVQLRGRDVLTHEAAQRARDLGVAVERDGTGSGGWSRGGAGSAGSGAGEAGAGGRGAAPVSTAALRAARTAAVVAELGREPAGLDAAIDRVLRSHA